MSMDIMILTNFSQLKMISIRLVLQSGLLADSCSMLAALNWVAACADSCSLRESSCRQPGYRSSGLRELHGCREMVRTLLA